MTPEEAMQELARILPGDRTSSVHTQLWCWPERPSGSRYSNGCISIQPGLDGTSCQQFASAFINGPLPPDFAPLVEQVRQAMKAMKEGKP